MSIKKKRILFLFRRDLRLQDNTGLSFALSQGDVYPAFILTPTQLENNPYRSDHCLQFMLESLEELSQEIEKKKGTLFFFLGNPDTVIDKIIRHAKIDAVVVNKDYTPYSHKRDQKIEAVCKRNAISFHAFDDLLLHPPEEVLKQDGSPYLVFTPYFRKSSLLPIAYPHVQKSFPFFSGKIPFALSVSYLKTILPKRNSSLSQAGGRKNALSLLKRCSDLTDYVKTRDFPFQNRTSFLSAALKFTLISPREAYHALSSHHPLIRSLYWRDFFTQIAYFFPHVFTSAFHQKYDQIPWKRDSAAFARWKTGTTGFPLVDAGMRQMNETGWMHNRVRMVVASFLTKDLHIHWQKGERYFAQTLIDYDPCVNNGNWQWVAGSGCDAQPYFRIFNPWSQQKKFDPECEYIKQWIPELREYSSKEIHLWHTRKKGTKHYPSSMVSHDIASRQFLKKMKDSL